MLSYGHHRLNSIFLIGRNNLYLAQCTIFTAEGVTNICSKAWLEQLADERGISHLQKIYSDEDICASCEQARLPSLQRVFEIPEVENLAYAISSVLMNA